MKRTMIILLIVAVPLFIWYYMRSKTVKVLEGKSEAPEPLKPNSTDYEADESDEIGSSIDKRKTMKTANQVGRKLVDSRSKVKIASTRDGSKTFDKQNITSKR